MIPEPRPRRRAQTADLRAELNYVRRLLRRPRSSALLAPSRRVELETIAADLELELARREQERRP